MSNSKQNSQNNDSDPIVGSIYVNTPKAGGEDYLSGRVSVKLPDGKVVDVNFTAFKNRKYQTHTDPAYFIKRAMKPSTLSTFGNRGTIDLDLTPLPKTPTVTKPQAQSKFKPVTPKSAAPQPEYQDPDSDPM